MRTTLTRAVSGAAALLLATIVASGPAASFLGIGDETYETFKGKFVDSKAAAKARTEEATTEAGMKAFNENGHAIGALDWDAIPAPEVKAYGEKILNRLLAGWDGPHPKLRLWITADPGLAAESTGNGDLYVARGWFDQADSEDEVAAIIAHEISHVLLNHFAREEANEGRSRSIASAASVATTAFALGSTRVQGTGSNATLVQDKRQLDRNIHKTLLIKFAIGEFSSYTLNAPWAREQEDQADLLGTDLLYRAKYNTLAMKKSLERLKDYEASAAKQVDDLSSQYEDTIKNGLESGSQDELKKAFADVLGNIALDKADKLRNQLIRKHPDTDKRIEDITKYIGREYDEDPGPPLEKNEIQKFRAAKGVKATLAGHLVSVKASAALTEGNAAQARTLAMQGLTGAGAGAPYALRIVGMSLGQSGDATKGLDYLRRAAASPDASFATVVLLASQYASARKFDAAHRTLEEAKTRFGSAEAVYPASITVALAEGKKDDAKAIYDTCMKVKNSDLVEQCRIANGDSCTSSALVCAFKSSSEGIPNIFNGLFKQDDD
ncbi:MAG TPA: M48 family metalloprotease [Rhizomicrobium sp.]|nr:M48 family metalloprotease [Rhizomicrobium sp.]